jgi:hypothetical protein
MKKRSGLELAELSPKKRIGSTVFIYVLKKDDGRMMAGDTDKKLRGDFLSFSFCPRVYYLKNLRCTILLKIS